jgi:hypothetical protein
MRFPIRLQMMLLLAALVLLTAPVAVQTSILEAAGALHYQMNPPAWSTSWPNATGNLQVFVIGSDAAKIDLASVELTGEDGDTVRPRTARIADGQLVAIFKRSEAIQLVPDPKGGQTETVVLRFTLSGTDMALPIKVRITGTGNGNGSGSGQGNLRLDIQPNDWLMNYATAQGDIKAFIRGKGLAQIDLRTVSLVGDDQEAASVWPSDIQRVGSQIVVSFPKNASYHSLKTPRPGKTHTVKVAFRQADAPKEITAKIKMIR